MNSNEIRIVLVKRTVLTTTSAGNEFLFKTTRRSYKPETLPKGLQKAPILRGIDEVRAWDTETRGMLIQKLLSTSRNGDYSVVQIGSAGHFGHIRPSRRK